MNRIPSSSSSPSRKGGVYWYHPLLAPSIYIRLPDYPPQTATYPMKALGTPVLMTPPRVVLGHGILADFCDLGSGFFLLRSRWPCSFYHRLLAPYALLRTTWLLSLAALGLRYCSVRQ